MIQSTRHQQGFTLIEIIVSMMLLAFISVFVGRSIQKGLSDRAKIQRDIDRSVALREAVNLISRDVQLAFNYRDVNIQLYNAAVKERCKTPTPSTTPTGSGGSGGSGGTPPPPTTPVPTGVDPNSDLCKPKEEKVLTQFIGESERMDFTALSYVRLRKDDPSSDQAEIGYQLKNCRTRLKGEDAGQCLWRRVTPYIDEDVTQGGMETVLIENVKSFTLRYLDEGTEGEWQKTWSSDGKTDSTRAGKFPMAVEITLQIYDKNFNPPKEIGMTVVAPLRFPNNPPPQQAQGGTDGAQPADASE